MAAARPKLYVIALLGLAAAAAAQPQVARAQDFFSALFGGFGRPPAPPPTRLPFADEGPAMPVVPRAAHRAASSGGGQAWCVRGCDGRYFPLSGTGDEGKDAVCHSFCPSSETTVVYGSTIDNAVTGKGKPYSEMANAFRYRTELVAGCTCNGHDPVGLASIEVNKDPTLRKGDIVAGADGLLVANTRASNRSALNFSPASPALQARYRRVPVVAAE